MKLNTVLISAVTVLAASMHIPAASDEHISSQSVVHGGFELRDGRLLSSKSHKSVTAKDETVTQFTVSPDGRFLVFMRKEEQKVSLWILNVKDGKRIRVGKDLNIGCCVLTDSVKNKGLDNVVSFVNGAFWTKKNEVLVSSLKGKGGVMEFFLSMNGELKGDV